MTPCPRCGVQPPVGALFCPSCGTRIVAEPDAATPKIAWDTSRPALPDDLFRSPEDEPLAVEDPGPRAGYEVYRRPDPAAPRDDDPTLVRPVPVPPPPAPPAPRTYAPGTPEADLLPSERPYVVPAPVGPSRANLSGARGVMILLGVLVLIAVMGGILWFSGGGGGAPTGSSAAATSKPASGAASSAKASGSASGSASATAPRSPSGTPADAFPPGGSTLCQGSTAVAVNSTTSCEFATNVAAAIPASASGTFVVTATSPVTQKEYEMTCVKGTYTVCSGGTNAVVFVK